MKTLKTVGIILAVVCVLLVGVWGVLVARPGAGSAGAADDASPTMRVTRGSIQETVSATGSVVAEREAHLAFALSARIDEVLVTEGQLVEPGQALVRVDSSDLEYQVARAEASLNTTRARLAQARLPASAAEIAQAEARLAQAKRPASEAEIASAQASIDIARANLDKLLAGPTEYDLESAKLTVDSARNQLWSAQAQRDATKGNRASSGAQKDASEAQVLVAEVSVQQALVALEKLQAPPRAEDVTAAQAQIAQSEAQLAQLLERPKAEDVAQAEAQRAQLLERPRAEDVAISEAQVDEAVLALAQAQEALTDAELTAPFGGTVVSVSRNPGEQASPGATVVHLADADHPVLYIMIDELDVAQVAEGQKVRLTFDALPNQEAYGTVSRVAPGATQSSGGVAYQVEIHLEAGETQIKLGMTARVDVVVDQAEDALLVPNRAIQADRQADRYYVDRKTALGTERIEVEIGIRDDDHTQIVDGLVEGDTVLLQTVDVQEAEDDFRPPFGPGMTGGR